MVDVIIEVRYINDGFIFINSMFVSNYMYFLLVFWIEESICLFLDIF